MSRFDGKKWWRFLSRKASSPAAAPDSTPLAPHTVNNNFHGPTNVSQGSTDVQQSHTSAPSAPGASTPAATGGMRIAGPWTDHEGLRSSWMIGDKPRPVRWISNGAKLGDLHPAAKGGGWDVYDVAGTYLGGGLTEKAGMELLKKHES